jgi:Ca2+-binding RTX toxin-like protein
LSHPLNLSAKTLAAAGALGAIMAVIFAVLVPTAGIGGTTPTTTIPPATCSGEEADVVMEAPGTYIATGAPEVIVGSFGDDAIRGTKGDDVICGRQGDDSINGGQGNDELRGDDGEDLLRGRRGTDTMVGGFDEQQQKGGTGGGEDDRCFGGEPQPDTGPKGDTASQCEDVKSARIVDIDS